ncbi:MAG: hypothetical protein ACYCX2_12240, partial [Christensenellales bacterium]
IDRSGNEAVALGVEQGDGGQMALRLSDGTVQNISDVTFADPRIKEIYEAAGQFEPDAANAFVMNYDGYTDTDTYAQEFDGIYTGAAQGLPFEDSTEGLPTAKEGGISKEIQIKIYEAGRFAAKGAGLQRGKISNQLPAQGTEQVPTQGTEQIQFRGTLPIQSSVEGNSIQTVDEAEEFGYNKDKSSFLDEINTEGYRIFVKRSSQDANEEWIKRGYEKPPYKADTRTYIIAPGKGDIYVRVFSYSEDGTSNKLGGWLLKKSDIEGLTPIQIKDNYALPEIPTHICDVNIPNYFKLQTGIAEKIPEWGNGGGQQFDTMGKRLPVSAFTNERKLLEE